jgi:hypothetical protein
MFLSGGQGQGKHHRSRKRKQHPGNLTHCNAEPIGRQKENASQTANSSSDRKPAADRQQNRNCSHGGKRNSREQVLSTDGY